MGKDIFPYLNSIQLARATELALPIIATTNIDNNIMLDSI